MNITVAPSTSTVRHRSPTMARRTASWTYVCHRLVVPGVMRRDAGSRALDGGLVSSARAMATRWRCPLAADMVGRRVAMGTLRRVMLTINVYSRKETTCWSCHYIGFGVMLAVWAAGNLYERIHHNDGTYLSHVEPQAR